AQDSASPVRPSLDTRVRTMNRITLLRTAALTLLWNLAAVAPVLAAAKPNVLIILADDMGFSDIGCYGGEIQTPNLDRLAASGLRYSQFYNTARCSPSRASLLTGLHPHQTGIGILTYSNGPEGYAGNLNKSCVTVAEVLKQKKYKTYLSGKWHISSSLTEPTDAWPLQRGFDYFFGTIIGAGSFYN